MPQRSARPCPRCRQLIKGPRCEPCEAKRKQAVDVRRQDDPFRNFYSTSEWKALRKAVLAAKPLCVLCGKTAKHVDHIVAVRKDPDRRLDPTNLRPLCWSCHSSQTAKHDGGFGNKPQGEKQEQ